jgi:hypothetical protein
MNLTDLKNGELVQFNDEVYGQGKAAVVGIFIAPDETEYCLLYPKIRPMACPYMCFLTKRENIVMAPF